MIDEEIDKSKIDGHYLYMLKIYKDDKFTGIVKIGVSNEMEKRISKLNKVWSEYCTFKLHKVSVIKRSDMHKVEKGIHLTLRSIGKTYMHRSKLQGWTEMFRYEEWMDNLIDTTDDIISCHIWKEK